MDILHIILILLLLICFYAIYNISRKNKTYETLVNTYDEMIEAIKAYMQLALNTLIKLDRQQVFESDDDVGFFFKSLKEEIIKLNNNIAGVINETSEDSETKKG